MRGPDSFNANVLLLTEEAPAAKEPQAHAEARRKRADHANRTGYANGPGHAAVLDAHPAGTRARQALRQLGGVEAMKACLSRTRNPTILQVGVEAMNALVK